MQLDENQSQSTGFSESIFSRNLNPLSLNQNTSSGSLQSQGTIKSQLSDLLKAPEFKDSALANRRRLPSISLKTNVGHHSRNGSAGLPPLSKSSAKTLTSQKTLAGTSTAAASSTTLAESLRSSQQQNEQDELMQEVVKKRE